MSDSPSSNSGPSPGVIETTDNKPNAEPTPHTHDNATSPPNESKSKSTDGQEGDGNEGASPAADIPQTPQVALTFLLVSGKRRTMVFEPDTTIGRVKELAWNSWPTDWAEERPAAPSYLRILYLGKMLQDDETLTSCVTLSLIRVQCLIWLSPIALKMPTHVPASDRSPPTNPPPTIVHLSVRAYPPNGGPETTKKRKKRMSTDVSTTDGQGAGEESRRRGGGCCIIC